MTRASIEAVTCDRCGEVGQFTITDLARKEWAMILCVQFAGPDVYVGTIQPGRIERESSDLCPPCRDDLIQWWKGAEIIDREPVAFIPLAPEKPKD